MQSLEKSLVTVYTDLHQNGKVGIVTLWHMPVVSLIMQEGGEHSQTSVCCFAHPITDLHRNRVVPGIGIS